MRDRPDMAVGYFLALGLLIAWDMTGQSVWATIGWWITSSVFAIDVVLYYALAGLERFVDWADKRG